ncbi:MAG: hypothetical protein QW791_07440 [Candidatus Bathyarchaeia archaeon]
MRYALKTMLTVADLLALIEEQKTKNIKQLTKETEIPIEQLHLILKNLNRYNLIEYDIETGSVKMSRWLQNLNQKIEKSKPPTGEIILPKYGEIKLQDIVIGNYTSKDLELKVRLKPRQKEIAICELT